MGEKKNLELFLWSILLILISLNTTLLLKDYKYNQAQPKTNSTTSTYKLTFSDIAYNNKTDIESIYFLVNKTHPIPHGYIPKDLITKYNHTFSAKIEKDLDNLLTDLKQIDNQAVITSSYRTYDQQKYLYDYGNKAYMAEPDKSEHQLGLAIDFGTNNQPYNCDIECKKELNIYKWLLTNSYKYGFILRYTNENENITGYRYEPWHFRYIGKEAAKEYHDKKFTSYEEFVK